MSRGDLLKVHLRPDDEIKSDVESEVLIAFFADESNAVNVRIAQGVVTLDGRVERQATAEIIVRLTRQVAGVVEVIDELECDGDDTGGIVAGSIFY